MFPNQCCLKTFVGEENYWERIIKISQDTVRDLLVGCLRRWEKLT